jgi:hypothetical protein
MFLDRIPKLNVQRLFAAALILKIISSAASLLLGSPWILGLIVPITVMIAYMVIGQYCRTSDVSQEKFADSCYYMGFIFTITSIIVSLFDLPNLNAGDGMRNIALRFGAAMVSTVLGMGVRVYQVGFRKDTSDAIQEAEDAVLDATRMLATQLNSSMDNLKQFEQQVVDATKFTVDNVNRQVEAMGTQYVESFNNFYTQVTEENKIAFSALINEVRVATTQLVDSVDTYSNGMKGNLDGIELKVNEFADAVTKRLATTTFPDDFFARELKAPLELFKDEATTLGESVRAVSDKVAASSGTMADALKMITTKTKKTEAAMDAVVALSEQHRSIVDNAGQQLDSLLNLTARLEQIDTSLQLAVQAIGTNSSVSTDLMTKVAGFSSESSALRFEIKDVMANLANKLDANATLATGVVLKLEAQAGDLRTSASEVIAKLELHTEASGLVAQRLSEASVITQDVAKQLNGISANNTEMIAEAQQATKTASVAVHLSNQASQATIGAAESVGKTATQVAHVADKMQELDASLRLQTGSLLDVVNNLLDAQEEQSLVVTNAVINSMALRPASSNEILNEVEPSNDTTRSNVSQTEPALMSDSAHPQEPIKNPVSSLTATHPNPRT